jgi:hypothetical protein
VLGRVGALAADDVGVVLHLHGSIDGKRSTLLLDTGAAHNSVCALSSSVGTEHGSLAHLLWHKQRQISKVLSPSSCPLTIE